MAVETIIHYYRKTETSHSLLPSCQEQLSSLGLSEDAAKISGIARVELAALDILSSSDMRAHILVSWDHIDCAGASMGRNQVRYVLKRSPATRQMQFEMIEYTVLCFPGAAEQLSKLVAA